MTDHSFVSTLGFSGLGREDTRSSNDSLLVFPTGNRGLFFQDLEN